MIAGATAPAATADLPMFPARLMGCLSLPGQPDGGALSEHGDRLISESTGAEFPFVDRVPSLLRESPVAPRDITQRVRAFYEKNPFPDYEGLEDFGELVNKGTHNDFSARLLDAIGFNKLIFECGCGTGQLAHFLQLNNNHVLGIDLSVPSLQLAIEYKIRNQLNRCAFAQMDVFDLAVKDAAFDVVISRGVLHHTQDPRRAFSEVARKVKPGGIVIVGIYNNPARLPAWIRRKLMPVFGAKIDYHVRNSYHEGPRAEAWIKHQYFSPHESWHTIDDVVGWFEENDVEFLNCSPAILGTTGEQSESLFEKSDFGTRYHRGVTQLAWLFTIARDGGLFDVIGRRRA